MTKEARQQAIAEARALMASKRAGLCSHGVAHDHCSDHAATQTASDDHPTASEEQPDE